MIVGMNILSSVRFLEKSKKISIIPNFIKFFMDSIISGSTEIGKIYDVIIIGTGSAGLPAGMYAARYKLDTLVIGGIPGGALAQSHQVENYP